MKKIISNILATTGLSLIVLSVTALLYHAAFLCISTVFETLGANILMHLGVFLIHKTGLKAYGTELLLDNVFIGAILIFFGKIFDWFSSTPAWTLIIIGIAVYFASVFLNLIRMRQAAREINELLRRRNHD